MNRTDLRRPGIDPELREDGPERRAEALEGLHRLPDIEHPELAAGAMAGMIEPARRSPGPRGLPPPDALVLFGLVPRLRPERDRKRHRSPPKELTVHPPLRPNPHPRMNPLRAARPPLGPPASRRPSNPFPLSVPS